MKTIVVDPGHGGNDPGAVYQTRQEKDDNLRLALAVQRKLQTLGQNVIMTRSTDVFVPLLERSAISNNNNADMFVSIHRNSVDNSSANGVENWVQIGASAAYTRYAQNVLTNIVNQGVQSNRGVKQGNFSVLRNTAAPAMLIEMGFITNPEDNRLFDQKLDAYAAAIANGIIESLGETGATTTPPPSSQASVASIQNTLNARYATGLSVDGAYGPKTKQALIKGLQTEFNQQYGASLATDGIWGPRTKQAAPVVRPGARGNITYLIQAALFIKGYPIATDGAYGPATQEAVRNFQQRNGLTIDGITGPNTFEKLFAA